jgi:hypothetical protein
MIIEGNHPGPRTWAISLARAADCGKCGSETINGGIVRKARGPAKRPSSKAIAAAPF